MSKIPTGKDKLPTCWLHPDRYCTPSSCVAFTDKSSGGNGCHVLDGISSLIRLERVLSQPTYSINRK